MVGSGPDPVALPPPLISPPPPSQVAPYPGWGGGFLVTVRVHLVNEAGRGVPGAAVLLPDRAL